MSAMGHEQTSRHVRVMSVNPLKAKRQREWHVRLVPLTDTGALVGARFFALQGDWCTARLVS